MIHIQEKPEGKTVETIPENVLQTGEGIQIKWSDGQTCSYPYRYLRLQCACASCIEEMTGRKLLNVASVPEDVIVVEYITVGKYALQFLWSDGHETGIYPYRMLLKLAEKDAVVECS